MTLRRVVAGAGAANLLIYLLYTAFSFFAAPAARFAERPFAQLDFHIAIGERVDAFLESPAARAVIGVLDPSHGRRLITGWRVLMVLTGEGPFGDPVRFTVLYALPLALATLITLLVLVAVIRRSADASDGDDPTRSLLRWSIAFAMVVPLAMPVLDPTFWMSIAWGRASAPFGTIPALAAAGLPLDPPIPSLAWGPGWLALARGVSWLTGGAVGWSAVAWKVVAATAWIVVLVGVARLARPLAPRGRAVAIVLAGWLPLGVVTFVGEGRPEIVCVALAVTSVVLAERGRRLTAMAALLAAGLMVPIAAPPGALDGPVAGYLVRGGTLALAVALVVRGRRGEPLGARGFVAALAAGLSAVSPHGMWLAAVALAMVVAIVHTPSSPLARWLTGIAIAAPFIPVLPAAFPGRRPGLTLETPMLLAAATGLVVLLAPRIWSRHPERHANAIPGRGA